MEGVEGPKEVAVRLSVSIALQQSKIITAVFFEQRESYTSESYPLIGFEKLRKAELLAKLFTKGERRA